MESGKIQRRSRILLGEAQCSKEQRVAARVIDLIILAVIFLLGRFLWLPIGWLGAICYAAIQDALGQGQSIGKRIIGLQVIEDDSGLPCSVFSSTLRNAPLILSLFFLPIPVIGILMQFVLVPILGLEVYLLGSLESNVRLGDVMGNTYVAERQDGLDSLAQ